jgi:hypothetical protein
MTKCVPKKHNIPKTTKRFSKDCPKKCLKKIKKKTGLEFKTQSSIFALPFSAEIPVCP